MDIGDPIALHYVPENGELPRPDSWAMIDRGLGIIETYLMLVVDDPHTSHVYHEFESFKSALEMERFISKRKHGTS